jgi:predicted DCC family thiol-disulfide oxidoreductase YuxK
MSPATAYGSEVMKTTMFFDGGCPLCSREVAHYRRLDRGSRILWVDITDHPETLSEYGIAYGTAMERLHALDEDGQVVSGVPAFVAVWRQLPGYRHLARVVEGLGVVPVLDWLYTRFASWRLKRRCRDGACDLPR